MLNASQLQITILSWSCPNHLSSQCWENHFTESVLKWILSEDIPHNKKWLEPFAVTHSKILSTSISSFQSRLCAEFCCTTCHYGKLFNIKKKGIWSRFILCKRPEWALCIYIWDFTVISEYTQPPWIHKQVFIDLCLYILSSICIPEDTTTKKSAGKWFIKNVLGYCVYIIYQVYWIPTNCQSS